MTTGTGRVFTGRELHIHVCGSIGASLVPWWVHWFREVHPDTVVHMSLTRSAQRFVTPTAIRHLANGDVWTDSWDDMSVPIDVNSGRSGDSECIIVFPATLDTLMRLAEGRSDTPALMMLQLTKLPVVVADSVPGRNPLVDRRLADLALRTNVAFAPRVVGIRASDRSQIESGFNLPGALTTASAMLTAKGTPHD